MEVIKPQKNSTESLEDLTKEELIQKVKALQSHNDQLKNILAKSDSIQKSVKKPQKPFDFNTCTFRHVLLKFLYLGWDYQGYAIQEDSTNTIEFNLFEALTKTCLIKDRTSSNYHRCGRTDKGVSAFSQVISINLRSRLSAEQLQDNDVNEEINYCQVLNNVLPDTIHCIAWYPLTNNDFSARFDCKFRTYKYFFPKGELDLEKMQTACKYLLGTHDYRNFCKMDVGNGVVKFVRNILSINISQCFRKSKQDNGVCYAMYVATIKGQAFLWHQIRCIMGVLFLIGQGKESPDVVKELLNIEKNPRKPEYNMASEVPLNLYDCSYDLNDSLWHYDSKSTNLVVKKLQDLWTFASVKATMMESILLDLQQIQASSDVDTLSINCLLNGVRSRKYIPLMQRQKCESLEDRVRHYVKRQKLEVVEDPK